MGHNVRLFQVDAFTSQRFCGNPAGVVLDADALSSEDMQLIARELNNGDTAFVLRPDADDHDLRVRFFTPRREAAFVGHATLAVHAVRASLQLAPCARQKQQSGLVDVDTISGASPSRIAIHQSPPTFKRTPAASELSAVLEALTLTQADLDPRCPPTIAGESSTRLLIGLAHGATLARLQPDLSRLTTLSSQLAAAGYFLFSLQPALADVFSEARMFCPALGIPEDPVSGNAHAMLGAYLLRHSLVQAPTEPTSGEDMVEFTGAQGHHVGRPGRVTVALNLRAGCLDSVTIIGEAVIVFSASLQFE
ncbi:MAG TPA: PhzF family phenazine biosynthesis isomerase [Steroidobacteraceae bacterium]|nr:PhzF family phenazine biosynthesis isomerase [Steroidobacteraceae bacterium]